MLLCAMAGSWCFSSITILFSTGESNPHLYIYIDMYIHPHITKDINVWNIIFLYCSGSCFIDQRIAIRSVKSCSCQDPQGKSHSLEQDQDCLPFPKPKTTVCSAAAPGCGILCAPSSAFPSLLWFPQCSPSGSQPMPRSLP